MSVRDEYLAKVLNCDILECRKLDSITLDVDEFYDPSQKSLDDVGQAVYDKALEYLQDMYDFAHDLMHRNPKQYDGSVLNWDSELLMEAIDFLDPKRDLDWGFDSTCLYLEMDYWDLYWSVIQTINEDYSSGLSLKEFDSCFTKEVWGGKSTPDKFDDLLL